jgi:hypothetical protein
MNELTYRAIDQISGEVVDLGSGKVTIHQPPRSCRPSSALMPTHIGTNAEPFQFF